MCNDRQPFRRPQNRYHLDGPTRIDKQAAGLLSQAGGLSLPRKWGLIPLWENLVQREVERLLKEYGHLAFEDLSEDVSGPVLRHRFEPGGRELVELTKTAEAALLVKLGSKCFRRVVRDDDGLQREFLIRRLPYGSGCLEVRLSWYGQAWPLVRGGCDRAQSALDNLRTGMQQPSLFEQLEEDKRKELDGRLRFMESIRNGRKVMEMILCAFGRDGVNPLLVPAWQLRNLLECETDPDGFRKLRGCLMALQEVRFCIHASGATSRPSTSSLGSFLSQVTYVGRGYGQHTDGDFFLSINPTFIGCLQAFGTSRYRLLGAQSALVYNWGKTLSKDEKTALRPGFIKGFSALAPYYDTAKGFTEPQSNLRRWIESQITLNKDGIRKDRKRARVKSNAPDANEPRLYSHEFCELIPDGQFFSGALGHHPDNRCPETGRTLLGTSSAAGGLLQVMGYFLPRGKTDHRRATLIGLGLQDMKAVVEEALEGIVVARRPTGEWLKLGEAAELPVQELLTRVTWYLFLPLDWQNKLAKDFEKHQAERHARGEVDYLVKVTTDRTVAEKSHQDLGGGHFGKGIGLAAEPLRTRLHVAIRDRELTFAAVGNLFGVSKQAVSTWEKGNKPIPARLVPLVRRWIETGELPTLEELAAGKTSRGSIRNPLEKVIVAGSRSQSFLPASTLRSDK